MSGSTILKSIKESTYLSLAQWVPAGYTLDPTVVGGDANGHLIQDPDTGIWYFDPINKDGAQEVFVNLHLTNTTTGATLDRTLDLTIADDLKIFHGTNASETITGTANDDIIHGGGGNDTIYAGSGDDAIDLGYGNNYVEAGNGNDWVYGGNGVDTVLGGSGDDEIHGRGGDDFIYGNDGNDILYGDTGNDTIKGGDGDDRGRGGDGNDYVEGNAGNDILSGEAGNDTILGGDGNDLLNGGSGDDQLYGGAGDDQFQFYGNFGKDTADGGAGSDVFVFRSGNVGEVTINNFDGNEDHIVYNDVVISNETLASLSDGHGNIHYVDQSLGVDVTLHFANSVNAGWLFAGA